MKLTAVITILALGLCAPAFAAPTLAREDEEKPR